MRTIAASVFAIVALLSAVAVRAAENATNPILWTDAPDVAVVKVGDEYFMSSTTMHMTPGVPIMKSTNLVDWNLVGYCYATLDAGDQLALRNGRNAYGAGSWASSLRYRDGVFYLATFSGTTGKTYIFSTRDPSGPWDVKSFRPMCHDCSLFFEDDGTPYIVYGGGDIRITELNRDLSGFKEGGVNQILVPNASRAAGGRTGLQAEGSQFFKRNGKYYLCNITWPRGDMRTEIVHRSDSLLGPYEGRVFLKDRGIAQGTIFEGPSEKWYAMLFQDAGAVGRMPYLIPVDWVDDWPVPAGDGKAPTTLPIERTGRPLGNIVESSEFDGSELPLAFQWNHNPVDSDFSFETRPGWLRLTTSRVDETLTQTRNTLTQRTFGPTCRCETALDASGLKDGDVAGLCLLQRKYGYVAVVNREGRLYLCQSEASLDDPRPRVDSIKENELIPLPEDASVFFLRAECDFHNRRDVGKFSWSVDGREWREIGSELKMIYTLPHFMGYRFGLFNQSTKESGGWADFDFFHVSE